MADSQSPAWTVAARWILPIEGAPLEGGTITIRGERILAVEPRSDRTPDLDLGDVAILPGFVNAHTHLDLSGLRGKITPTNDFTAWLGAVIAYRRSLSPQQLEADTRAGLDEALRQGTTLLGDISGQGLSWKVLASSSVRAVVFYELLGLPRVRAQQAWAGGCAWLRSHPATATCRPGLSPHAPYSVRASLFRAAAALSERQQIPLAIHLAETRAELELLEKQNGPFRAFLEGLGVWGPAGLIREPQELLSLVARAPGLLFAHANYLEPTVAIPPQGTIVYCPRTHAAFGHDPHPFRRFLERGVRVALGTDSLASNPDLSVLAEARFLRQQYPEISAATLLHMATLAGAEALGWRQETGSLVSGKSADLVAVPLPDASVADPHEAVLQASAPVRAVLSRGRWVYSG